VEELQSSPRPSVRGNSIRNRILLLCLLPTLFLGATYLLLVEFVLRESIRIGEVPPLLRFGGIGLVALFALVSLGCGFSLADSALRPLRSLQRIADGANSPEGAEAYDLLARDPDLRRLFTQIQMLTQQQRAGLQALAELDALHRELGDVRNLLRECAGGRGLPALPLRGSGEMDSTLVRELDRFCSELRAGMREIDEGLRTLDARLSARVAGEPTMLDRDLERLERLGTVWALNVEMSRRPTSERGDDLGACFRDFSTVLGEVRSKTRPADGSVGSVEDARSEVARLRRIVAQWLRVDREGGGGDAPSTQSRGESR
jgi:hypothetical protein